MQLLRYSLPMSIQVYLKLYKTLLKPTYDRHGHGRQRKKNCSGTKLHKRTKINLRTVRLLLTVKDKVHKMKIGDGMEL